MRASGVLYVVGLVLVYGAWRHNVSIEDLGANFYVLGAVCAFWLATAIAAMSISDRLAQAQERCAELEEELRIGGGV